MIMFSFTEFPKPSSYLLLELSMLLCKTENFNSAERVVLNLCVDTRVGGQRGQLRPSENTDILWFITVAKTS